MFLWLIKQIKSIKSYFWYIVHKDLLRNLEDKYNLLYDFELNKLQFDYTACLMYTGWYIFDFDKPDLVNIQSQMSSQWALARLI